MQLWIMNLGMKDIGQEWRPSQETKRRFKQVYNFQAVTWGSEMECAGPTGQVGGGVLERWPQKPYLWLRRELVYPSGIASQIRILKVSWLVRQKLTWQLFLLFFNPLMEAQDCMFNEWFFFSETSKTSLLIRFVTLLLQSPSASWREFWLRFQVM